MIHTSDFIMAMDQATNELGLLINHLIRVLGTRTVQDISKCFDNNIYDSLTNKDKLYAINQPIGWL